MAARRASRAMPPWITTTAAGSPTRAVIFCCRYSSVSLGSVKIRILRRRPVAGSSMIGSSRIDFKLAPFRVLAGKLQAQRALFEILQDSDFGFELGERCAAVA